GLDPAVVARERARAAALPQEMQCALATLLAALMDAAVLQTRALGTLTPADLEALSSPSLTTASRNLLLARGDPASAAEAARLVDRAVRETAPVLEKWGLLLQVASVERGLPVTADHVAGEIPRLAEGDPRDAYRWALRLAGHDVRGELPEMPAEVPSLASLLWMLYLQLEVPVTPGVSWAIAGTRHLPDDLEAAAARNLAAIVVANAAWTFAATRPLDTQALLAAEDLARLAAKPGATPSDILLLRAHVDTIRAAQNPAILEAAALLLSAAAATAAAPPAVPTAPWWVVSPPAMAAGSDDIVNETVLGSRFAVRAHANGSYELFIDINGDGRRDTPALFSPAAYVITVDEARCRVVITQDENNDGLSEGQETHDVVGRNPIDGKEPANSQPLSLDGEILFDTGSSCDPANDVIFRDPFGYVAILGDGSSVVGDDFGAFPVYATNQRNGALLVDNFYNTNLLGFGSPAQIENGFYTFVYGNFFRPRDDDDPLNWMPECGKDWKAPLPPPGNIGMTDPCQLRVGGTAFMDGYLRPRLSSNTTINPDRYQYLTIDLGGDDLYLNNAGGTFNASWLRGRTPPSDLGENRTVVCPQSGGADAESPCVHTTGYPWRTPVALAIDLGGDDRYAARRAFTAGSAGGGVGLLYDVAGDDRYEAKDDGLGAANATAVLLDVLPGVCEPGRTATTCYRPRILSFPSAGLLVDLDGDDTYSARFRAIGFGQRALFEGVGTPDSRCPAVGQLGPNFGCIGLGGLPTPAAVGLVLDVAGRDLYRGDEYTLGAANHSGLGLVLDLAGDDTYASTGRPGHSQGQGHGTGHGLLLDLAGRDTGFVSNGGFALGAYVQARFNITAIGEAAEQRNDFKGRGVSLALDLDVPPLASDWDPGEDEGLVGFPNASIAWRDLPLTGALSENHGMVLHLPALLAIDDATGSVWRRAALVSLDLAGADVYLNAPGRAILNTTLTAPSPDRLVGVAPLRVYADTRPMGYTAPVALSLDLGGADLYDASRVFT
ncbi:MAG TPA: hypothetical protein VM889_10505, partial [Candidatus Thermoplasmatota archaeon]|nr:hypothetical protein [Candidatus Thermoplasmatota archaeon]